MKKQMIEEQDATLGMPPLFPGISTPEVAHTVKAEHLEGRKKRGRPRNYAQVREMMDACQRVTYTLRKDNKPVLKLICETARAAWEASRLCQDLLRRRVADECTIKYTH